MKEKNTKKQRIIIPEVIEFTEPTRPDSKYRPEYDEMLYKHLAKGLSWGSFDVGVTNKTMNAWLSKHPSFALARERGEKKRLQLLEAAGMKMIVEGNATAWKYMMAEFLLSDPLPPALSGDSSEDEVIEAEMKNVTPERSRRLARIRELGKKLKIN
jgi:hypothetical protein